MVTNKKLENLYLSLLTEKDEPSNTENILAGYKDTDIILVSSPDRYDIKQILTVKEFKNLIS